MEKIKLTVLSYPFWNQGLDSVIQTKLGALRLSSQPQDHVGSNVILVSVTDVKSHLEKHNK